MNPFKINCTCLMAIVLAAQLALAITLSHPAVQRELRRVPENALQLKESTTTAETSVDNIDDVFAIPIDDFRDYWYGRRIKKRSILESEEDEINQDKKSQYQPWGGKRARYTDIFQMPKGFNPNGGKRAVIFKIKTNEKDKEGRKRTSKTFQNWAGKRSGNKFVIWGGKKRADSFRTWGGKRSELYYNYR